MKAKRVTLTLGIPGITEAAGIPGMKAKRVTLTHGIPGIGEAHGILG